jgi:GT2 family glycosyltransferase
MTPKVMVGICTAEYARRADFYDHFELLHKPLGTLASFAHGQSPARNRNTIIRQALKHECTHVFFMDDDVLLPPDTLLKLLEHDKDIVSGLYLMRNHPHQPIAFAEYDMQGRCSHIDIQGKTGLVEVVATGLGCLLVKSDVFNKLEEPWIRMGELESDMWCDDLGFYKRARDAGYKGWLDTDIHVEHIASMTIKPVRINGEFRVQYNTNGSQQIIL